MKAQLTLPACAIACMATVACLAQPASTGEMTALQRKARNKISNYNFLQQTLTYSALSYVSPPGLERGGPKSWYILSADIIPQFVLGGEWTRFTAHLTARYKVRILHDDPAAGDSSAAVRTPSFMPGASVYYSFKRLMPGDKKIQYVSLSFFHHSNGQDGNEFNEDGSINTYNGNFSTNYIEPAYHFRRRNESRKGPDKTVCDDAGTNYEDWYGRVGLELHYNTSTPINSSYGNQRLNITLGYILVKSYCDVVTQTEGESKVKKQVGDSYFREKHRVVFNLTLIGGERDHGLSDFAHRINSDISYYWRVPSSPNTSLFCSVGYVGSDTYNIYYQDNYFMARAGIALGFFIAPHITGTRPPAEIAKKVR